MTARAPLITAILFAALLLVGSSVAPAPPDFAAPGADVVAYYRDHDDAVALQAWLIMAAIVPGALLVAFAGRRMTGLMRTWFVVPTTATVVLIAIGLLFRLGLAAHPETLDPDTARTLSDVEAYWGPLATFAILSQAVTVALGVRDGRFPRWLAAISLVLAAEQLAETATLFGSDGFLAPGGDMNALLGPTLYAVWVIGLGVACSEHDEERERRDSNPRPPA